MCALLKHFRQNALNFITETSISDSENGKAPVQQTLHPKKKEDKEREEATKKDLNFFNLRSGRILASLSYSLTLVAR